MAIGLKRGTVRLAEHDPEWEQLARETIGRLRCVLGSVAKDIQHVGSTSIPGIKAKPIIDIAVAVENFADVEKLSPALEAEGFLRRKWENDEQILFACGDYSKPGGEQTHFIHVVKADGVAWRDYLNFRDYLNATPSVAKEYEALKVKLANENPDDKGREKYLAGKYDFIEQTLRDALVWRYLGTNVTVTVDRPLGSVHPKHADIVYPINYGFIAGEIASDGEELDAYVLGVDRPVAVFEGFVIAIVRRENDVEDKLVVASKGTAFTPEEIAEAVRFQEQYYKSHIQIWPGDAGLTDIPAYSTFLKIEPLNKGWSNDKKYTIETTDGKRLLLRIADISEYDRKKTEFETMQKVAALGVPMPRQIDFGVCDDGKKVYQLLSWVDGEDAETALPLLTETEQYVLGVKSGEILRKIHSIPTPKTQEDWEPRFNRKTSYKIQKYRECGLRFEGDDRIIDYIEQNRGLLANRPQCCQHGDYHVGNMIISGNDTVSIIDWNRPDFGDPWEEFNRIVWSATVSPYFATGQLRGYFGGEPPIEFFRLLAFYISNNTLSSIYWAIPFGQGEVDTMMKQTQDVLRWFDNMQNPVPIWYLKDFYLKYIDGVPLKLKSPFDLNFIHRYGTVFKVFDDQDSGNLCFGVKAEDGKRYFIKFAGAPTEQYKGDPADAVSRLKATVPVYQDLAHPTLIRLVKADEIGGGFAVVFEWVDAVCLHRMYPSDRQKFLQIPMDKRIRVFEDILEFHARVIDKCYVAIDFYDGSIMYDLENSRTVICDIDFYTKAPYTNNMGRLWGSTRFMSPEEFQLGAVIDEITNVYGMGATAFALFSECDRSLEKWPLGEKLYAVIRRAVSDKRSERQQSIQQLIDEWEAAK